MAAYADSEFYRATYFGEAIPDDRLDRELARASWAIDAVTDHRIDTLSDRPAFVQKQVKLAVCAEADARYKAAAMERQLGVTGVGSYSIGDVSVSLRDDKRTSAANSDTLSGEAYALLLPTGLLDRRL